MLPKEKIDYFKKRLEEEAITLKSELESVGEQNPDNPADWVARAPTDGEMSTDSADRSEVGDRMEALGENAGIVTELEVRYNHVLRALKKIEDGAYGICEISKKEIGENRLEANPAARTCTEHMNDESSLSQ